MSKIEMDDIDVKAGVTDDSEIEYSNRRKESIRKTMILTSAVCLVPIVIGIIFYSRMPDTIVTHWDAAGNPNGWSSKFVGIIVFPGALLGINILFPFLLQMDPKYSNMDEKLVTLCQWIIPFACIFASGTTLAAAMGREVRIAQLGPVFIGIVFAALGNYLPKAKQTYTMGIKLPWTLNNEENWNKTHRLTGFLWVGGGFFIIIAGLLGLGMNFMPAVMIIMVIVPTVYSFILYKKGM